MRKKFNGFYDEFNFSATFREKHFCTYVFQAITENQYPNDNPEFEIIMDVVIKIEE